ncbi:MAG: NusG domain II-containing protein [Firmicutes bacterium]|nr:NusG domain II-containing protein [Bacillota bacterium]
MIWKKGDLLIVALVLAAALVLWGLKALPAAAGSRVLVIEQDGKLLHELPLAEDRSEVFVFEFSRGEASVEIENGRVRMLPISKELCPQGICSHVGWIEHPGDAIVCLPNRLVLTIVGGDEAEMLDGVTW